MAQIDKKYHELVNTILEKGRWQEDPNRQGVKRLNIPRYNFEYDLKDGFPAITTKKLAWKSVVGELLWFLRGDTNIKYLLDNNIHIWDKDCFKYWYKNQVDKPTMRLEDFLNKTHYFSEIGDCGRIYGYQLRNFDGKIDQFKNLIEGLIKTPLSSEHIVTYQSPSDKGKQALPPCHKGFQIMVYELTRQERVSLLPNDTPTVFLDYLNIPKYGFDLVWEQRSVDTFLGLPFNIASYTLLAHIIGVLVNMVPGKIYGDLRNVHLYDNSIDAVKEQLKRDCDKHGKCCLQIDNDVYIDAKKYQNNTAMFLARLQIKDFTLENYESYPQLKTEMLSRD